MAQHRHPELSQLDPPILDNNSAGYCRYEDAEDTEVSNILMLVSRAVLLTIVAVNGIHRSLAERSTPKRWCAPSALRSFGEQRRHASASTAAERCNRSLVLQHSQGDLFLP